jgi:uncharacterized protein YdbL (DUF1318 family)
MSEFREGRYMDRYKQRSKLMEKDQGKQKARPQRTPFARFQTGLVVACLLAFTVGGALAAESKSLLDTAKKAGQVGEKFDGYIGLVDQSAPENIKKMVKDTNERREARYGSIAIKRGTTVESVAKQAAAKILKRVKPGEMIQTADGKWTKK